MTIFAVLACGGPSPGVDGGHSDATVVDSSDLDTSVTDPDASNTDASDSGSPNVGLNGVVQKGPFVIGTSVVISVLDTNLAPTGTTFVTSTNALASFSLSTVPNAPLSFEATGSYYNEATGALSDGVLTLRGLYVPDGSSAQQANINILTHITRPRVQTLMLAGAPFAEAAAQAETELMAALDITADSFTTSARGHALRVDAMADDNAYLLGLSTVVMKAAQRRQATNGGGLNAHVQEILNAISLDLEPDGAIANTFSSECRAALRVLDIDAVELALEARLTSLGTTPTLPDMRRALDTDDDELADAVDNCPYFANAAQLDEDADGIGNGCDPCFRRSCMVTNGCTIQQGNVICIGDDGSAFDGVPPLPAGMSFEAISGHCAIRSDGLLQCFGAPMNEGTPRPPTAPPGVRTTDVSATTGQGHGCAVRSNGTIACWGRNTSGEGTPPSLPDGERWWSVRVSSSNACGLATSGYYCWGSAGSTFVTAPVGEHWINLTGNGLAVSSSGTVYLRTGQAAATPAGFPTSGWRDRGACHLSLNGDLFCGAPTPHPGIWHGISTSIPCAVNHAGAPTCFSGRTFGDSWGWMNDLPIGTTVLDVDLNDNDGNVCALLSDNTLRCWWKLNTPFVLPALPAGTQWVEAHARASDGCARRSDGAIFCQDAEYLPPSPGGAYRDFDFWGRFVDGGTACALSNTSNQLYCWRNEGDLGGEGNGPEPRASFTLAGGSDYQPGLPMNCGLDAMNRPYADGTANSLHFMMNGNQIFWGFEITEAFRAAPLPNGVSWIQADCGMSYVCGLRSDGELRCADTADWQLDTPVRPTLPQGVTLTSLAAVHHGMCGLRSDGVLSCWSPYPGRWTGMSEVRAPAGTTWERIVSGGNTVCAFGSDGRFECWGVYGLHPN